MAEKAICELCGEPMPPGEEMFQYHGYSGPCPKPPKKRPKEVFTAVSFPDQYPRSDVAEHEVLMSFHNDDDAIAFREWWHDFGAAAFAARKK